MKYILLILGLAAITAGSTYYVAPQLREFHEGRLKERVIHSLKKSYSDVEVEMNHLHAASINLLKVAEPGETKSSIQGNVVRIVSEIPGVITDKDAINVTVKYKPRHPEVRKEISIVNVTPKEQPKAKPVLATVLRSIESKGSVEIVDLPESLTLNGTVSSKADFDSINDQLEPLVKLSGKRPRKLINNLRYHPAYSIEKNDEQRAVILSGYANRNDSVNLSSYIKRYTEDVSNHYEFKSEIVPDARSTEYEWTSADQTLLGHQLKRTIRCKVFYKNDLVSKVTGVTNDEEHHKMLQDTYFNTVTELELIHDQDAKPLTPMSHSKRAKAAALAKAEEEQREITKKLRSELKRYKIFFKSGKKSINAKYGSIIEQAAKIILKSEDKKSLIVIGGFADNTGDAAKNERLSKQRASSVQARLVELGVPITRTVVEFFGAEGADVDKKLSRRVEIRVR